MKSETKGSGQKRAVISAPVPQRLKDDLNTLNDELSSEFGFQIDTSDVVRMSVLIYLRNIRAAIEGKEIYSLSDLEYYLNAYTIKQDIARDE